MSIANSDRQRPARPCEGDDECPLHTRVFLIRLATEGEIQRVLDLNGVSCSAEREDVFNAILSLFRERDEVPRAEIDEARIGHGIGAHLASMRSNLNSRAHMQEAGLKVEPINARIKGKERWVVNFVGDPRGVRRAGREEIKQVLGQPMPVKRSGLVDVAMPFLKPKGYIEEWRVKDAWDSLDDEHAYLRGNLRKATPLVKAGVYIDVKNHNQSKEPILIARSDRVVLTKVASQTPREAHGSVVEDLMSSFSPLQTNLLGILMRQEGHASLKRLGKLCKQGESVLAMIKAINEKLQSRGRCIYVRRGIAVIGFSDPYKKIAVYEDRN